MSDPYAEVVRERKTEERIRALDTPELVEAFHGYEDEIAALEAEVERLTAERDEARAALDHPLLRFLFARIEDSGTPEANTLWGFCLAWFEVRDQALDVHERITFSGEASRQIAEMLLNPPEPNPALRELMKGEDDAR